MFIDEHWAITVDGKVVSKSDDYCSGVNWERPNYVNLSGNVMNMNVARERLKAELGSA